ncbi:MAG: methyltransferase domain-containing protein [Chloroflexi bacterium]|nr:methyltransferase domain-containing protein [Chloroflexota bacterium]
MSGQRPNNNASWSAGTRVKHSTEKANRRHWDEVVPIHASSDFYRVREFRAGEDKLKPVEIEELGDVRGKTLLHLQCHFGVDTLSWARDHGAIVTGIDFSERAIQTARELARDVGVTDATFVLSDLYGLPERLDGEFDIVFTSYGAITWLPDIRRWARVAAHFVKPGGTMYLAEFHPMAWVFDDSPGVEDLVVRYPYFHQDEPLKEEMDGTYADRAAPVRHRVTYAWSHTLGDVTTALIDAGLQIQHLHEFPFSTYQFLPFTQELPDHTVRLTKHDGSIPLLYSIKATRPA